VATIWTQTEINELKAAIASGIIEVTFSGPPSHTVKYHSLTDMRSLLAEMTQQVAGDAPYRLLGTNKGFHRGSHE
jgi:hypothetical protein